MALTEWATQRPVTTVAGSEHFGRAHVLVVAPTVARSWISHASWRSVRSTSVIFAKLSGVLVGVPERTYASCFASSAICFLVFIFIIHG